MVVARRIGSVRQAQVTPYSCSFATSLAASIAGPALLSLAFPPFNAGVVALVALIPLFLLWSKLPWPRALRWGWLSGALFFLATLYWTSLTVFEFAGAWSVVALALLCTLEGFSFAATAVTTALVARGAYRVWSIFAIPSAWLIFESIRTRGSLGLPFGELGLSAAHVPLLLPIAAGGGVYLLSTCVALANAALAALLIESKPVRVTGMIALTLLGLLIAAMNMHRSGALLPPNLRVAIAQGNIEQDVKWSPGIFAQTQAIYTRLTRMAAERSAKVVVWPETAITTSAPQDPRLLKRLETLTTATGISLLAGTIDSPTPERYYNALLDLAPDGSIAGVYHKYLLVPFAEYVPASDLFRRLPGLSEASAFQRGSGPHLLSAGGYRWGPLICFESAFSPYARATANAGADVLVIATDDAWFSRTSEPYQHADAAVVAAVATGRWIVRAASTGISEIIDPHGNVIASLGVGQQGIVVGTVGRGTTTLYDRYGVAWLLSLSLLTVIGGLLRARGRSDKLLYYASIRKYNNTAS